MGCIYAVKAADTRGLCPFCRTPAAASAEEKIERLKERADANNVVAIYELANFYNVGRHGLRQTRRRQLNSGLGQESLGVLRHSTILVLLIAMGEVWGGI